MKRQLSAGQRLGLASLAAETSRRLYPGRDVESVTVRAETYDGASVVAEVRYAGGEARLLQLPAA